MSRKKNRHPTVEHLSLTAYAAEGKSIGHLEDGKVVFVTGAVPGDVVNVRLGKQRKNWAEGQLLEVVSESENRIKAFCPHFGVCGGCKWQMLPYPQQLVYKQQQVSDQLRRIGNLELPAMEPIVGSEKTIEYRNKLEFTFSAHRYRSRAEITEIGDALFEAERGLGFHAPGLFDKVVPIYTCYLQGPPTDKLLAVLRSYSEAHDLPYYNFKAQEGYLRNAIIRVTTTGQVLVNIVFQHENKAVREAMLAHLLQEIPEITTLHYTINGKVNDSLHDQEVKTYYGPGFITEKLERFSFKISPKSFFQTNTKQAERLYQITRDFADLKGDEVLYDLYCGTGSIGIFCSEKVKKVIGIEVVADAIADAKENATSNGLDHCHFFVGDVATVCTNDFFAEHGRPDCIILDPPRAGLHEKLINQLLAMEAPKMVYVSCNPATQARDLDLLSAKYRITRLQAVDMFPHTHHIENVAKLELIEN